jgi:cytochrome c5
MLKSFLIVSTTFLFAIASASTIGSSAQETHATPQAGASKNSPRPSAEALAKAKRIYKMDCSICHSEDGSGKTDVGKSLNLASDWTFANTLSEKSDSALFDVIRKGKGNMPAEAEGRADNSTVKALVYYIRTLSKADKGTEAAPAAPPATAPAAEAK